MSLPAVLRIGPGHPLYHRETLSLEDFAQDTIIDTPAAHVANSRMVVKYVGFTPKNTILEADGKTRRRLVAGGMGYSVGYKLPEHMDEEYGFRNIVIPNLTYKVMSVTNPLHPLPAEAQRYLELLDKELEGIRIDQEGIQKR